MATSTRFVDPEKPPENLLFRLAAETRANIYENVLIHPIKLLPNGLGRDDEDEPYGVNISILQTCRVVYNEALPILYGKNLLAFNDCQEECVYRDADDVDSADDVGNVDMPPYKPVLPFPKKAPIHGQARLRQYDPAAVRQHTTNGRISDDPC